MFSQYTHTTRRGVQMTRRSIVFLFCSTLALLTIASAPAQELSTAPRAKLKAYTTTMPARDVHGNKLSPADASANSALTTFTYNIVSSRDGNAYSGAMVGQDPFSGNFTPTTVNAPIVPLIITTNSVATNVTSGGILTTKKGTTTFNPTTADNACLGAPNNVPLVLMQQSPIFQPANFKFGHTFVGKTQYIDAFQRGNFWQFVAGTNYHTLVSPH